MFQFTFQANFIKLINRLLSNDTKRIQQKILYFINDKKFNEFNRENFKNILTNIIQKMPYYFNLIEHSNSDQNVVNLCEINVEFLQFFRYLAEQQNSPLQLFLGNQGFIVKFIGLLEILLKSKVFNKFKFFLF